VVPAARSLRQAWPDPQDAIPRTLAQIDLICSALRTRRRPSVSTHNGGPGYSVNRSDHNIWWTGPAMLHQISRSGKANSAQVKSPYGGYRVPLAKA
jgi:hypothetical protein